MIFRQILEIIRRLKWQTRRCKREGEWLAEFKDGSKAVMKNGRCKYRTGRTYPMIPKRGQKACPDGRIRLLDIREERVQQISEADARAEGVGSVYEYRQLWDSINDDAGTRWIDDPEVFVYIFEFVPTVEAKVA